jgi:aminobenzoyl-glutamate utilization protein B
MDVAKMPTAFIAVWGENKPVIGINGEYDALPGLSQEPVPYKSPLKPGAPGHGCGHNIHGVSGLAGAIAAKNVIEENNIDGTIKYFGCPAEENYEGKVFMVRSGLYEDVDVCLSHHPGQFNTAPLSSSNAMNSVKFHFHGKTSHAGSSPEQGRSSLDAIELMNVGVNYLREHVIDKARIHYVIEEGGGQPNVVPDYARSWYYIRAPEREQVDNIYGRIQKIADGAALMTETDSNIEFLTACYNKLPNEVLSDLIVNNMREIGAPIYSKEELDFAKKIGQTISREEKIDSLRGSKIPNWEKYLDVDIVDEIFDPWDEGNISTGSTDVSDVSWNVPTLEFRTASFVLGIAGHSWQAVACSGTGIGHKALIFAGKTIAGTSLDLIQKPKLLEKAKRDFIDRKMGRNYICPIPKDVNPPLEQARAQVEALKNK